MCVRGRISILIVVQVNKVLIAQVNKPKVCSTISFSSLGSPLSFDVVDKFELPIKIVKCFPRWIRYKKSLHTTACQSYSALLEFVTPGKASAIWHLHGEIERLSQLLGELCR